MPSLLRSLPRLVRALASGRGLAGLGSEPPNPTDPSAPWHPSGFPESERVVPLDSSPDLSPTRPEWTRAGTLFALTVASTWLTGGAAYAFALLTILLCHEMGHYLMCRRYRVRSSLPLFLPMPILSPFGTMGAVIRMNASIRDRRVLYDIGIAGPLAGAVPALLAVLWGLQHSQIVEPAAQAVGMVPLGESILFQGLEHWFFPTLKEGQDVLLHPVAFAGWAGFFVTALNLIPVGQLDGGHVLYGLFGPRAHRVAGLCLLALLVAALFYPGWWLLTALLLLMGYRHPPTVDESVPLDRTRIALGVLALALFVLCFVPQPFLLP